MFIARIAAVPTSKMFFRFLFKTLDFAPILSIFEVPKFRRETQILPVKGKNKKIVYMNKLRLLYWSKKDTRKKTLCTIDAVDGAVVVDSIPRLVYAVQNNDCYRFRCLHVCTKKSYGIACWFGIDANEFFYWVFAIFTFICTHKQPYMTPVLLGLWCAIAFIKCVFYDPNLRYYSIF